MKGYSGARYKKFLTQQEAIKFVTSNNPNVVHVDGKFLNRSTEQESTSSVTLPSGMIPLPVSKIQPKMDSNAKKYQVSRSFPKRTEKMCSHTNKMTVYTDGACKNNGRNGAKAGVGVYWGPNDPNNVSARLSGRATNNRAEIHAAIKAITQAKSLGCECLTIKTDSMFMMNSIQHWIHKWKRNNWQTQDKKDVKNKSDFMLLDAVQSGIHVIWVISVFFLFPPSRSYFEI